MFLSGLRVYSYADQFDFLNPCNTYVTSVHLIVTEHFHRLYFHCTMLSNDAYNVSVLLV